MTVDLRTSYLGLELRSPLVASPSPLTGELDGLLRLEAAGVGAVVLPSLFEEQLTHDQLELDRLLETTADHTGEATSYFPDLGDYNTGPWSYLDHISQAKRALSVPVIASLNGITPGGWVGHAKRMRDAGADALELNLYTVATDPQVGAAELEARYLELVAEVRSAVSIPLAVKLSPFFTALANFAVRVDEAGRAFHRLEVRAVRIRLSAAGERGRLQHLAVGGDDPPVEPGDGDLVAALSPGVDVVQDVLHRVSSRIEASSASEASELPARK
jgi:dihydroorotate dehydrogenase (fumarate)